MDKQEQGYELLSQQQAEDLRTSLEILIEHLKDVRKRIDEAFPSTDNCSDMNALLKHFGHVEKWIAWTSGDTNSLHENQKMPYAICFAMELIREAIKPEIDKISAVAEGRELVK